MNTAPSIIGRLPTAEDFAKFAKLEVDILASRNWVFLSEDEKLFLRDFPNESMRLLQLNYAGSEDTRRLVLSYSVFLATNGAAATQQVLASADAHLARVSNLQEMLLQATILNGENPSTLRRNLPGGTHKLSELGEHCTETIESLGWKYRRRDGDFIQTGIRGKPKTLYSYLVMQLYLRVIDTADMMVKVLSIPAEQRNPNALKHVVSDALKNVFRFPDDFCDESAQSRLSHTIERVRGSLGRVERRRV